MGPLVEQIKRKWPIFLEKSMWNHGCLCMLLTTQWSHWSPAHDLFAYPYALGWWVCTQRGEPFALTHSGTVHLSSGVPAGRKCPFPDLHKDAMRALSDLGQWELKCRSYALKCSEFRLVIKFDVLFSKVASFAELEETCSSLKMNFSWMIFENYFFMGNVYVFISKNCL